MGLLEDVKSCYEEDASSVEHASKLIKVFRHFIKTSKWETASNLLAILDPEVEKVEKAPDVRFIAKNMTHRVLKIIRDEYANAVAGQVYLTTSDPKAALYELATKIDAANQAPVIKEAISNSLLELLQELKSSVTSISGQVAYHITAGETIMTFGYSRTVVAFLKAAHDLHPIRVVIPKDFKDDGAKTYGELDEAGIDTTYIYHNTIFSVMPQITKVVIGAHKVLMDGTVKHLDGVTSVVNSAKYFHKDIIVCAGVHKFTMEDLETCMQEPNHDNLYRRLGRERVARLRNFPSTPNFIFPIYDFIGPKDIKLFIFNSGPIAPDKLSSLKNQLYFDPKDIPGGHLLDYRLIYTWPLGHSPSNL